jgi:hypothetical protein
MLLNLEHFNIFDFDISWSTKVRLEGFPLEDTPCTVSQTLRYPGSCVQGWCRWDPGRHSTKLLLNTILKALGETFSIRNKTQDFQQIISLHYKNRRFTRLIITNKKIRLIDNCNSRWWYNLPIYILSQSSVFLVIFNQMNPRFLLL